MMMVESTAEVKKRGARGGLHCANAFHRDDKRGGLLCTFDTDFFCRAACFVLLLVLLMLAVLCALALCAKQQWAMLLAPMHFCFLSTNRSRAEWSGVEIYNERTKKSTHLHMSAIIIIFPNPSSSCRVLIEPPFVPPPVLAIDGSVLNVLCAAANKKSTTLERFRVAF